VGRRTLFVALVPLIALAGCGGGSSATDHTKVIGRWTRNMTVAAWGSYGSSFPSGPWMIDIKKSGAVDVYTPHNKTPDFTTHFSDQSGGRFVIGSVPICSASGTYRWKRSGSHLNIKVIADKSCGPRAALWSGTWTKK
jgi:hypothetical protein